MFDCYENKFSTLIWPVEIVRINQEVPQTVLETNIFLSNILKSFDKMVASRFYLKEQYHVKTSTNEKDLNKEK